MLHQTSAKKRPSARPGRRLRISFAARTRVACVADRSSCLVRVLSGGNPFVVYSFCIKPTPWTIEVLFGIEYTHPRSMLTCFRTAGFHGAYARIAAYVQGMAIDVRAVDHA